MRIALDHRKTVPLYQQVVEQITRDIALGKIPAGFKLPTVRELAKESGISPGTIKHAYDMLEQSALIHKTRGSGTFVCATQGAMGSTKAQVLQHIDEMLDKVQGLSFSLHDLRIFLDLKIREREETLTHVRVAAVDCNPEALAVMASQITELPHTEVITYILDEVLKSPGHFDPPVDLVVTTSTHYQDLMGKMIPGSHPCRLVMTVATDTALELAALPEETRLGIITASERYAQLMLRACGVYGKLKAPVKQAFFGDRDGIAAVIQACNRLLLPSNYALFASQEEAALLSAEDPHLGPLFYRYQVERGSLLFLEEQIHRIFKSHTCGPQAMPPAVEA
ncbi:MAG: GntR family transcriptional regulator [Spirochaetaceae bacterium]|jgi:DNA-binding transcriptional regulator YhcF (GntR family)|nr:GntR family transcriptional regulator [Spirochaetaceae bacterium]